MPKAKDRRVSAPTKTQGFKTFKCYGCDKRHPIGWYAVAQCAMGHILTHTCEDCKQQHRVRLVGRNQYKVTAL